MQRFLSTDEPLLECLQVYFLILRFYIQQLVLTLMIIGFNKISQTI